MLSVLYVYSYGDHRDLHSFPTRRSSDLRARLPRAHPRPWPLRHDACEVAHEDHAGRLRGPRILAAQGVDERRSDPDRKSTRLNSSHPSISYAVFCLKKKKTT